MYVRSFVRLGGPAVLGISARTAIVAAPTAGAPRAPWSDADHCVRMRADMIELLERLVRLREQGALTAGEFDVQKAKLLRL